MMPESKPWYLSKINLLNLAGMAVEIIQVLGGAGVIPPGAVTIVTGVGTIILRQFSTQPIRPLFAHKE